MVKAENIVKKFGDTEVLKQISFEINEGEYLAVMGPSGSGKSTLLYSVSGMDSITEGSIFLDQEELTSMTENKLAQFRLEKMGFVFQSAQMLKNLSVLDNIMLPGLVAKQEKAETIRSRAHQLLKDTGIEEIADRDIGEVSGGQLQRASICRAMINNPSILFMDEPTGALNSEATEQILEILHKLNHEGMTIMLVTHDPKVAACASKVLYLRDGETAGWKDFTESTVPENNQAREKELNDWLYELR